MISLIFFYFEYVAYSKLFSLILYYTNILEYKFHIILEFKSDYYL